MATITSNAVTGNWSATSSWVGNVVPDPLNDAAVVAVGAVITLDDSRTIPATVVEGRLTQGTGATTTLGGALQIGNGGGKDGQFDFGAGATLALGTYNLVLANCKLTSNATTENWAAITGSGNIQTDTTTTYPAQDINLRYVSHQNTGSIHYAINSITGAWAPVLDIQHCAFYGNGDVVFGEPGWNSSVNVTIKYSDFDNTGDIGLVSAGGGSGITLFEHNTLRRTSGQKDVYVYGRSGIDFATNIYYGYGFEVDKSGNAGPHTFTNNFFARLETESSTGSIIMDDTKAGYTISNNYFYAAGANPHIIQSSGGWSGGGTHAISDNIFEIVYNSDGANPITIGKHNMDVYDNLLIGSGSLVSAVASGTSGTINEYNNTYYGTYNVGGSGGGLWLTESNISGATINIYNNLQSGSLTITYGVANIISGQAQPLGKVGYNNFYNTTTPYAQGAPNGTLTFGTDNTSYDLAVNPNFVDPGCTLAAWGTTVGADGTTAGAIAKLLAVNGYNSTTKKQSDTPSGATVASLISWVQAGFVPRNAALKTAGEGGTYIGAMDVTVNYDVSIEASIHAQAVDNAALNQNHVLISVDASFTQSVANATIEELEESDVQVISVVHAQMPSNIILLQDHVLVVASAVASQSVENVGTSQNHVIVVSATEQSQTTDNATLNQNHVLNLQNAQQSNISDVAAFLQQHILLINAVSQSSQVGNVFVFQGALIAHPKWLQVVPNEASWVPVLVVEPDWCQRVPAE